MRHYGKKFTFVLILATMLTAGGCSKKSPKSSEVAPTKPSSTDTATAEDAEAASRQAEEQRQFVSQMRPQVEAFCADCHVMPRPTSSTHDDWKEEVEQGFMLYRTSGRKDLKVPSEEDVLKFFQYQAPQELVLPSSTYGYPDTPVSLESAAVTLPSNRAPAVTNVRWLDLGMKGSPALVYCNIGTGAVTAHWPGAKGAPTQRLATLLQPVHSEACDLDADGHIDLVVADIGEFNANDSNLGRVIWLRRIPDSEKFETIVLQEGLSRVADVRPGDFDGDGDLDLIVAVFGWRNSGRTVLLENQGAGEEAPLKFQLREIDDRHGPSHVPTVDINGDGHLDFIALISQDHEVIEAFINDGKGSFKNEVIWQAPDPAYGSSGVELVDMDNDGDLDILYTNGDSFDRGAKPYHSVQWLENEGSFPYRHHHLCEMPGVLNAKAADFDGDGDIDVVATSLLSKENAQQIQPFDSSSVVMLIQEADGKFTPTKVEGKAHQHISIEIGDFNEDTTVDFAIGNFLREGNPDSPDLIVWWNK